MHALQLLFSLVVRGKNREQHKVIGTGTHRRGHEPQEVSCPRLLLGIFNKESDCTSGLVSTYECANQIYIGQSVCDMQPWLS